MKKESKKQKKDDMLGLEKKYQVLMLSGMVAVVLIAIALFVATPRTYSLLVGLSVTVAFIPYSLYTYSERKDILEMEDNLPAFLRDIAGSRKSGLTLPQAVYRSAHVDYGKLTKEVTKMANQISWGIPFNEVLKRFSDRSKSKFIQRSIAIIIEAQVSGGALIETLDSVARDARLIKESEKERRSKLNAQAMVMYAIFFLFVAIVVTLQRLMIPLITARGFTLMSEDPQMIMDYYRNLFFSMIVIQGIFNGMLAGQIAEGSVVMGLKHSAIFLLIGMVVSWVMIF